MTQLLNYPLTPELRQKYLQLFMEHWGTDLQADMLMEEAMELALAIRKWKRGKGTAEEVREEMADVQLMLDQMRLVNPLDNGFQGIYDYKMRRTLSKAIRYRNDNSVTECSCYQGVLCFVHDPTRKKTTI